MASAMARNGGQRQALVSAIRKKFEDDARAVLRPEEAVLILEWAVDSSEDACQKELLHLFGAMGGLELVRNALLRHN